MMAAFPETFKRAVDEAIQHHKLTYKFLPKLNELLGIL
jgi:hypothetical protein